MSEIFFHLGIGKTGTKFLQYDFFPFLKNTMYIHRWRIQKATEFISSIKSSKIPKKILYSGEYDVEIEKIVKLISKSFPHSGIILVFRRQDEWILSQYKRFIKNGYHLKFKDFFNLKDGFYYKPNDLFFYPKIELILSEMKKEPLFLNYDSLKSKGIDFLSKISKYIGVDFFPVRLKRRHTSYSEKQLKYSYIFSKFLKFTPSESILKRFTYVLPIRYSILYLGALLPSPNYDHIFPSEQELEEIREFYREDWEKCLSAFAL